MKMVDWVDQLDYFIKMSKKDIFEGKGMATHEEAIKHAKEEYEKYRQRMLTSPTPKEVDYFSRLNILLNYTKEEGK